MKSGLAQQECGKDSDCWNERCEHALPIWAKLQALIYGAPPFVRAGYASVREKLDDITRRDCEFPNGTAYIYDSRDLCRNAFR